MIRAADVAPSVRALALALALNTEVCRQVSSSLGLGFLIRRRGAAVAAIPTAGVLVNAKQDTNMLQESP